MANKNCGVFNSNREGPEVVEFLNQNCEGILDAFDKVIQAKNRHDKLMSPFPKHNNNQLNEFGNGIEGVGSNVFSIDGYFATDENSTLRNLFSSVKPAAENRKDVLEAYVSFLEIESNGQQLVDSEKDRVNLKSVDIDLENLKYALNQYFDSRPILNSENAKKVATDFENFAVDTLGAERGLSSLTNVDGAATLRDDITIKLNAYIGKILTNMREAEPHMIQLYRYNEQVHTLYKELKIDASSFFYEPGVFPTAIEPEERARRTDSADALLNLEAKETATFLSIPPNFREQCLFLAQIFQFAEFHKNKSINKPLPYAGINQGSNASLVIEGSPFGFINRLTQYASMSDYFDATNDQLAHLQPLIRIFKVTPEKGEGGNGSIEREQEFAFDTFASKEDVSDLLKATNRRGFGIGIEKFNFTFHGSNPFAIKKSIKANLVIKANNFSELLRPRGPNNSYRYIDLALKTGKSIKEKTGNPELDYRIKAVVGLSVPNGKTTARYKGKGPGDTGDITEAVKNNFATLNLTPVIHTFDFDDTGAVTFSIEYLAYIEEFLDKARMNVFADPVVSKRMMERRLAIQTQKTNCSEDEQVKNLNSFLEEDAVLTNRDKITSLQFLTRELLKSNKMYYLNLNKEQFKDLVEKGPFYDVLDLEKAVGLAQSPKILQDLETKFNERYDKEKKLEDSVKNSFKISDLESKNYAFFYLGDLVDLILKKIPENLGNMRELGDSYRSLQIEREKISEEEEIIAFFIREV